MDPWSTKPSESAPSGVGAETCGAQLNATNKQTSGKGTDGSRGRKGTGGECRRKKLPSRRAMAASDSAEDVDRTSGRKVVQAVPSTATATRLQATR